MSTTNDRRAHPRVAVELWVDEHHGADTYYQRAGDLSVGGMYLPSTIPHPTGTRVNLEFTLPGDDRALRVRAEVVGGPDGEVGMHLRFLDLDAASRDRIERFVTTP